MNLNLAQLQQRVAAQYPDVEQVGSSVIRFTRATTDSDQPFAVYYLDITEHLPSKAEELADYQDHLIGGFYFDGAKSLQWNNYLYFIASRDLLESSEARRAKRLIESDRRYARKYVISEEELDSVLDPPVVTPAPDGQQPGVLSIWMDRLVSEGLDQAILSDDDLPSRLELIESSSPGSAVRPKPQRSVSVEAAPFIHMLELKKYREYPVQRRFEFGTVNLIFGPNASGKTSLLEAIELFYCGRNKRNPDLPPPYEFTVTLADGNTDRATNSRGLQIFRDRNLVWYGQSEIKTSNLYQSFARFNFLDTDAAVGLADSTSHAEIEEDLSKLLVGPAASKTWRHIERVSEAIGVKLREVRPRQTQIGEELASLENRLKEAAGIKRESDSIHTRLEKMVRGHGWDLPQGDKETVAASLVEAPSELISFAHQAASLAWIDAPASTGRLTSYCDAAREISNKVEPDIARLETLRQNQMRLTAAVERDRQALDLATQATHLIDAGVPARVADRKEQDRLVATYSGWLAGVEPEALNSLPLPDSDMTVAACREAAASKRSAAERDLASVRTEYADFSQLRDRSVNLAQQLRQVASEILEKSTNPDECPLCHTRFQPGELAKHIGAGIDEHLEVLGQTLLTRIRQHEAALREATAVETALAGLMDFCDRAGLSADVPVRSALTKVEHAEQALAEARGRFEAANNEILRLEKQGLSLAQLDKALARLAELGYPLAEVSGPAADRLIAAITEASSSSSQAIQARTKEADELETALQKTLNAAGSDIRELKAALSQLKERLSTTESIQAKLGGFLTLFPWPGDKPIAELAVAAESVRTVAAELQAALGRERDAGVAYTEFVKRKEQLERQASALRSRIQRLADAASALDSLQKEHSLTDAMESALRQNRAAIEAIFSRIHAPAEFSSLGSTITSLVRKSNGSEARLSEISTGQRAAFGLSIFLAQNSQLTAAPPAVLIDDPIAHVDDLNSLSFLDYLREIALTGKRQIYFTTANDKLAVLFQRKFDFLGAKEFRRFDLSREDQWNSE